MTAAGMEIDRTDFTWSAIEQSFGVYDFSWYDKLYANLTKAGVALDALLDYGNKVLFGPTEALRIVTPNETATWLDFVNATVRHFSGIQVWEIWNEPNLSGFWNGTEDQFFSLLGATAELIHSIDPNLMVMSPGISGSDTTYLNNLITYIGDANYSTWFGACAFHPYSGDDAQVVSSRIQAIQAVLTQHHFYGQLWITEWGYATTSDPAFVQQDFALQGSLLTKVYTLSLAQNISRVLWYSFREDGFGTQYDPAAGYNTPGPTGQNVMDPAGYAFLTLSSLLTNSTYLPAAMTLGTIFVPTSQLWAYTFLTSDGHLVLIAWNSLGPYTLSISSSGSFASVLQINPLTGTNASRTTTSPSVTLSTETPIILDISFNGAPAPLVLQITPMAYTALVLFGLPLLFVAGVASCVWSYRRSKTRNMKGSARNWAC
jgi:hypothetical protein